MLDSHGSKRPFIRVVAFVDWNSQILRYKKSGEPDPVALASLAFKMATRQISNCLAKQFSTHRFQVFLRFYHGWYKGFEPTINKKAMLKAVSGIDFATLSDKPSVIFSPDIAYGDCLLSALPERLNKKLQIHLPNTMRDRDERKGQEEKMVDTALASDVIVTAYQDPQDWIVVVSEDDDFIPPLFVAESIIKRQNSRALLLSARVRGKNLVNLENISVS